MINTLAQLREAVKQQQDSVLAVANAQDNEVLSAVNQAYEAGFASAILVGDQEKIITLCQEENIDYSRYQIIDEKDPATACLKAVELVSSGKADVLVKGLVDTSIYLKAILDKEVGLRSDKLLSHVALFEVKGYDRLLYVCDVAMNVAPDLAGKKAILENAVEVAHKLGNPDPIVAGVCAVEKVNEKMQATLDAKSLVNMQESGQISGCKVVGPLALDNAVSVEAAHHKGITNELAGRADILLMPDIEAGNILYKALVFLAYAENAGVILGAKAPIVLTSRADSDTAKLNSIALALYLARS